MRQLKQIHKESNLCLQHSSSFGYIYGVAGKKGEGAGDIKLLS